MARRPARALPRPRRRSLRDRAAGPGRAHPVIRRWAVVGALALLRRRLRAARGREGRLLLRRGPGPSSAPDGALLPVVRPPGVGLDAGALQRIRRRELYLEGLIAAAGRGRRPWPRPTASWARSTTPSACRSRPSRATRTRRGCSRRPSNGRTCWPGPSGRGNRGDEAVAAVGQALALQPQDLPALVFLGDVQRAMGRVEPARRGVYARRRRVAQVRARALRPGRDRRPGRELPPGRGDVRGRAARPARGQPRPLPALPRVRAPGERRAGQEPSRPARRRRPRDRRSALRRGAAPQSRHLRPPGPGRAAGRQPAPWPCSCCARRPRPCPRTPRSGCTSAPRWPGPATSRPPSISTGRPCGCSRPTRAPITTSAPRSPRLGRDDEAVVALRRAVELHPEFPQALFNLGAGHEASRPPRRGAAVPGAGPEGRPPRTSPAVWPGPASWRAWAGAARPWPASRRA